MVRFPAEARGFFFFRKHPTHPFPHLMAIGRALSGVKRRGRESACLALSSAKIETRRCFTHDTTVPTHTSSWRRQGQLCLLNICLHTLYRIINTCTVSDNKSVPPVRGLLHCLQVLNSVTYGIYVTSLL